MELWDVYDENREKTGRTHERGIPMREGDYHLVVHVWIVNDRGEFLIQKRQPWKDGWPDMWDGSAAGSAVTSDTSIDAAIRETKEELGVDLDMNKGELLFTIKSSCNFEDIWLARQNVNIKDLKLQYEEVADAKWATKEQIEVMIRNGEFIAVRYIDRIFEMVNNSIRLEKAINKEARKL